ncbi:nuclear transport factor 2 family protein [Halopiger goleimassiliensis]|uniref:nuclear transport factor 2 family protein n=1 Tax=Halopiger goleimassiliensis TaxID=1293048 RepID=UPI0006781803|nr:nuclear transport factor 2 family protein [Halopiger goleimassiliensis]
MTTSAADVVRDYYDALRAGDPLVPYFRDGETTVKFGISEALFGTEAVADALREQTATTDEWSVESERLVVDEREGFATFADEVTMAWTDTDTGDRMRFDTRWSGTLVPSADADGEGNAPDWQFATMHVSTADEL